MKTSKIITALVTLNLVLFMSVSSIANPFTETTGDLVKTAVKKQISTTDSYKDAAALSADNEFSHLRFDVNKFINESETAEFVSNAINYLRFDVTHFVNGSEVETLEMPIVNQFEYLRFDVNAFTLNNSSDNTEMPVNQLDYLRFDVKHFSTDSSTSIEIPVE